jgi:hypothetical protein
MLLSNDEMQRIQQAIEAQSGLDPELARRCGQAIRSGATNDAVLSAFVLLEKRLRAALSKSGGTGVRLSEHAFHPDKGVLAERLKRPAGEKHGLFNIFTGAFMAYRNPAAHGRLTYTAAKAKGIIALVNLLLQELEEVPRPLLPENVLRALARLAQKADDSAAQRLRAFVEECIRLGLGPDERAVEWVPFRTRCVRVPHADADPKAMPIAVFYLAAAGEPRMRVLVDNMFGSVPGFDTAQLTSELEDLGFEPAGAWQEPHVSLRLHSDQGFFDALLKVVRRTVAELKATLRTA